MNDSAIFAGPEFGGSSGVYDTLALTLAVRKGGERGKGRRQRRRSH